MSNDDLLSRPSHDEDGGDDSDIEASDAMAAGVEASISGASADITAADDADYGEPSEEEARMIELVGYLVQGIVAHPDEVEVEEYFDDIGVVYGVHVHADDVGRIIGKDGRIANALRQVVKAAATKTGAHVMVEIITEDTPLNILDGEGQENGGSSS